MTEEHRTLLEEAMHTEELTKKTMQAIMQAYLAGKFTDRETRFKLYRTAEMANVQAHKIVQLLEKGLPT